MPETEIEIVFKEWLLSELRSATKDLIIFDCRGSNEYLESHIRSAVNFSIPSIMLRRFAAGKIDMLSAIKSRELKERIQSKYKNNLFVLYDENCDFITINHSSCSKSDEKKETSVADEGNVNYSYNIVILI